MEGPRGATEVDPDTLGGKTLYELENHENPYVTQDDAGVDYAAMRKSTGFAEYSALAKDLGDEDLDLGTMSEIGIYRSSFLYNVQSFWRLMELI